VTIATSTYEAIDIKFCDEILFNVRLNKYTSLHFLIRHASAKYWSLLHPQAFSIAA